MLIDQVCQIPNSETLFGQYPDFESKIDPPYCSEQYEAMPLKILAAQSQ
jgi:uncharacterized protein VirK/YbjX